MLTCPGLTPIPAPVSSFVSPPGEPTFLPTPRAGQASSTSAALEEDDGVVLSVVMSKEGSKSFVLVLDAASMKEIGRAYVSFAVPYRFHGAFVPSPSPL